MSIDKYSKLQLKQLKIHEQVEARRNRVKHAAFMNELRQHQTRDTYNL